MFKDIFNIWVHFPLFCDYLWKQPSFYSKQSLFLKPASIFTRDQKWQTHPKRHSYDDLKNNTAETPYINCPWLLIVIHHTLVELFFILSFVLMDNIIKDLRWHVLRCRHGELSYVSEFEGRTIVNELYFPHLQPLSVFIQFEKDVLCFQVGVNNLALTKKC